MPDRESEDHSRSNLGLIGDASLALALITAVLYAGGQAYRDAYYGHWLLPAGEPAWDTSRVFHSGFFAGGILAIFFLIWLAAAPERMPLPKKGEKPRALQKVRIIALLFPIVIFFVGTGLLGWITISMGKDGFWALALVFGSTTIAFAIITAWFGKSLLQDKPLLGRSRGFDTAVVALVALGLFVATVAYGSFLGDQAGKIDTSGAKSTLMRVSFTFTDNTSSPNQWRLLAHTGSNYYVFTFDEGVRQHDRPIVTIIPDSVVRQATLTSP